MGDLHFTQLRAVNVARCVEGWKHELGSWSFADWAVAVGGEVGEALNIVKKLNRERDGIVGNARGAEQLRADLLDELADAAIYADLLLASVDRPLGSENAQSFDQMHSSLPLAFVSSPLSVTASTALNFAGILALSCDPDLAQDRARFLVVALASMAGAVGGNLGQAIVSKFNRTSEKHGMPHRLVWA